MIFVDTSAFIALIDLQNRFSKPARYWWQKNKSVELITTNLIIIETLGWIRYKCGKKIAVEAGNSLLFSHDIQIERVTLTNEQKAWALFQELQGRGISMIDCTSFILMKRLKIKDAFTFDSDFKKQGFTVYPGI